MMYPIMVALALMVWYSRNADKFYVGICYLLVRETNKKILNRRHEKLDGQMRPMGAEFPVLIAFRMKYSNTGSEGRDMASSNQRIPFR